MTWVLAGLVSAFFLGLYDLCKKHSVRENAVFPVLFYSVLTGALIWLPWVLLSWSKPESLPHDFLYVDPMPLKEHLFLFIKATIVGSSWVFSYFALKHLPVSIAGTIRATSPVWTLIGAIILYNESPTSLQWLGITLTIGSFFAFSLAGKKEGIVFTRNKWIGFMILANMISSSSALYDKYLLSLRDMTPATVQAWFTIYLFVFMTPFYLGWKYKLWQRSDFRWRWTIPFIAIGLLCADYAYFSALKDPEAMISILSPIRRGSVLITFTGAYFLFKERNYKAKVPCLIGILIGVILVCVKF